MNKDIDPIKKFLGEVEDTNNNESMFDQTEERLFESPVEEKEEVVEEKDEKPLPFHKDPKIQKYLDKREKEMEERFKSSFKGNETEETKDEFSEVISSFTNIIGNDTPEKVSALNALQKALVNLDERAAKRAEEKIQEIQSRESEADREAEQELDNAFDSIEENFDVDLTSPKASKIRTEFISFVEKIAPKDRNGDIVDYPDMTSAWETFSEMKSATRTPSRAKELASRSMARSAETAVKQDKRISWNSVEEMMDTLKN